LSKLADARTDVLLLVAHLEKIALPTAGDKVWNLPVPTAPAVQWPAVLDLDSCLLQTCEVATQCLDERPSELQIKLDVAQHREALLKEHLGTLKAKERHAAPRYNAYASTAASSSTCSSPREGLNIVAESEVEDTSSEAEGTYSESQDSVLDTDAWSQSASGDTRPEADEMHLETTKARARYSNFDNLKRPVTSISSWTSPPADFWGSSTEICGIWDSVVGEGRISWDHYTFWHSWEQRMSDTERLHGFLVPMDVSDELEFEWDVAPLCWQSMLTTLDEGQDPWREPPSAGISEIIEAVLQLTLRPGDRLVLEIRMLSDGDSDDCHRVVVFRRAEDASSEQHTTHLRSCLSKPDP
jgi:hypothetical protein